MFKQMKLSWISLPCLGSHTVTTTTTTATKVTIANTGGGGSKMTLTT